MLYLFPELCVEDIGRFRRVLTPLTPHRIPPLPFPESQREAATFFEELSLKSEEELEAHLTQCRHYPETAADPNRFDREDAMMVDEDYEHWCKCDYWTIEEFAALLLERKPEVLRLTNVNNGPKHLATAAKFMKYLELLERAVEMRRFGERVSPAILLKWATEKKIKTPMPLVATAIAHDIFSDEAPNVKGDTPPLSTDVTKEQSLRPQQKAAATKKLETLQKLFIGCAIDGYGYKADARKSPFPRELCNQMASMGTPVDEGTIRTHLKEAQQLLPAEALEWARNEALAKQT